MAKLALCIITKGDEELKHLKKAVASVGKYANQVVITTNSNKVKETKQWCLDNNYTYTHLPWNKNFSEQRNYNFNQTNNDIDWILWLDSDDEFIEPDFIPEIIARADQANVHGVFLDYWYGCLFKDGKPSLENLLDVEITQKRERFLRKGFVTWKSRLHETPVPVDGLDYKYQSYPYSEDENPFAVLHKGAHWQSDNLSKMARNRELLELQLIDEGENPDPRTLLYLMKIYIMQGEEEWQKCLDYGNKYLELSGWDAERCEAATIMGRAFGKLDDHQAATEIIHTAIVNYPYLPTTYFRLAEAYINAGNYRLAKHWYDIGLNMELPKSDNITNIYEMKQMAATVGYRLAFQQKDLKKAATLMKRVYELDPNENNKEQMEYVRELATLDQNCERADKLLRYLIEIDEEKAAYGIIEALPHAISDQPFARQLRRQVTPPRKWAKDEICYYASFNNKHFEEWGFANLEEGIGGSETAVLQLSLQWAKKGYHVTIYGDPGGQRGKYQVGKGSVTILPWYFFNPRDHFNVFIQWRASFLAGRLVCKKFLVDLHDVFFKEDVSTLVDSVLVKSKYHKNMGKSSKYKVISNGI